MRTKGLEINTFFDSWGIYSPLTPPRSHSSARATDNVAQMARYFSVNCQTKDIGSKSTRKPVQQHLNTAQYDAIIDYLRKYNRTGALLFTSDIQIGANNIFKYGSPRFFQLYPMSRHVQQLM